MMTVNMILIAAAIACAVAGILLLRTPSPKKDRMEPRKSRKKEDMVKVCSAAPSEPVAGSPEEMVIPVTEEEAQVDMALSGKPAEEERQESGANPPIGHSEAQPSGEDGKESGPDEDDELGGMPLMMFDE